MAQIPWATAQADRSREEIRRLYGESEDTNGSKTVSKEEELLAALLGANEELLEAFRIYDDLQRLGIMEQEEKEVQERSRKEIRIDRTVCVRFKFNGPCLLKWLIYRKLTTLAMMARFMSYLQRCLTTSLSQLVAVRQVLVRHPQHHIHLQKENGLHVHNHHQICRQLSLLLNMRYLSHRLLQRALTPRIRHLLPEDSVFRLGPVKRALHVVLLLNLLPCRLLCSFQGLAHFPCLPSATLFLLYPSTQ